MYAHFLMHTYLHTHMHAYTTAVCDKDFPSGSWGNGETKHDDILAWRGSGAGEDKSMGFRHLFGVVLTGLADRLQCEGSIK